MSKTTEATTKERILHVQRLVAPRDGVYMVSRTSDFDGNKPCDEAYEVEIMVIDRRCCDDPKKIPTNKGENGDWYNRGSNHRIENGEICRDLGWRREWVVDIDNVMDFVDAHDERCVVSRNSEGFATIEIYDDYRE